MKNAKKAIARRIAVLFRHNLELPLKPCEDRASIYVVDDAYSVRRIGIAADLRALAAFVLEQTAEKKVKRVK